MFRAPESLLLGVACGAPLAFAAPSDASYLLLQRSGSYDLKKVME